MLVIDFAAIPCDNCSHGLAALLLAQDAGIAIHGAQH